MAYILQGTPQKLNGVLYAAGDVVPDEAVSADMVRLNIVVTVPDSSAAALAEGRGQFDPSQHTVDAVLAYVRGHLDRAEAIREAEVTGGNRVTLLEGIDDLIDARDNAPGPEATVTHPVGVDESTDVRRVVSPKTPPAADVETMTAAEQEEQGRQATAAQAEAGNPASPQADTYVGPLSVRGADAAAVGEHTAEERAAAARSEGLSLAAADREAALAKTPKVGEPARGATSADLGDEVVDAMRKAAGTDPAGEPNPSAPVPPFDPGNHTAAEVLAHVDRHPDQLAAVGRREQAGKKRRGLLDDLARRLPPTP